MVWGAVIGAVVSAASIAVQAGMTAKAQKDAKDLMKKTSAGEQSMLALQKMKATDLASMGGLSAGQYQRGLMAQDAQAMQAQGMVNAIEQNPFADAFKKEALARMMISQVTQSAQQMQMNLADLDVQTAAKNAIASSEIARGAAAQEGIIVERQNQNKLIEVEQKRQMWSNFSKLAASTAGAVGQFVKAGETANWWQKTPVGAETTSVENTVMGERMAAADVIRDMPNKQTTTGIVPTAYSSTIKFQKDLTGVHSDFNGVPTEFGGFGHHYVIDGFEDIY